MSKKPDLSELKSKMSPEQRALLEKRLRGQKAGAAETQVKSQAIPRRTDALPLPLSFAQQRMWFLHQLEPVNPAYNEFYMVDLQGDLNVELFEKSLHALMMRHESLRTTFRSGEEDLEQVIASDVSVPLVVASLLDLPEQDREAEVERRAKEQVRLPFDLEKGPLFRATLLQVGEKAHRLLLCKHHIISDGWSMAVFVSEFATLYEAFSQGAQSSPLPELPIQYADYALWQRERLQGEVLDKQLVYWRQQLSGDLPALQLPTDHPRPPVQTYVGAVERFVVERELADELNKLSQRHGVTLFMTLLAAFQALLSRYSGQEDILVGTPIHGRNRQELEGLIGFFVNTLVMRTDLSGDPTFAELLARVKEVAVGGYAHADVPFEKLVEDIQPERDMSRSPLFQVLFVLQNAPRSELTMPGLTWSTVNFDSGIAKFDMNLALFEQAEGLVGAFEYNTDLFDRTTVERMIAHYQNLLRAVVLNAELHLTELPLLSEAEQQIILQEWNATHKEYPQEVCLHQLFERQVEQTPDALAVQMAEQTLTYRELNERANRLAHLLRKNGVGPEVRVGVSMERSLDLVTALYGTLKAGGAYVPIDPGYPQDRLAYLLEDSGVELLLTQEHLLDRMPVQVGRVLCLDSAAVLTDLATEAADNLPLLIGKDNAAYMIYTSGSTGKPKGVLNTHRGIVNRLLWMQDEYQLTAADRVLQKTPFSFDVSVWEFFWPLFTGACLVVAKPEGHRDSAYLVRLIQEQQITTLHFVPSMLQVFLEEEDVEACTSIRQVMCSGEALPFELQERFFARLAHAKLHNLYGPTEAAVDVSYWECQPDSPLRFVPIGRPVANTSLYILDARMQPVPIGVAGELHIGGVQLARGYHNRAELTAEKFVANPFGAGRLYKTGDLARFLADGTIQYLGRLDHQVKIRGFRIELGEIENALLLHPKIEHAAVIVRQGANGSKELLAFYATEQEPPEASELKDFLAQSMPEHMIPFYFQALKAIPLSPNGKVDRKELERLGQNIQIGGQAQEYVPPANELQAQIAAIWSKVLGREQVGIHDNFFDLGGHSLLVMKVQQAMKKELGIDMPMMELFQYPTVKLLADGVAKQRGQATAPKVSRQKRQPKRTEDTDIAIIGIGLRFPDANDVYEFWDNLRAGRESIRFFAEEELEPAPFNQHLTTEKLIRAGAFLEKIDQFDAAFFQIPEREARMMDPQHRIFLECAWEAIQNAGYDVDQLNVPVSLYAGATTAQYMQPYMMGRSVGDMYQAYLAGQTRFLSTRVSYKLNLTGESLTVDTACSTSLVAVHMACRSLLVGDSDYALAGGVSIAIPQKTGYVYEPNFILSADGHVRTFDKQASGTVTGNGAGVVFLKRLADARRDGDPIYAVIKGTAINNDGHLKIGYTAPSVQGQAEVIRKAQEAAGVDPDTITYIEAHGTGTQLGDPIEIAALTQAFREQTDKTQYCAIGSVKTNIGHLDTAAGIAGLIKSALALKYGEIPPSLHFTEPNSQIPFAETPFYVNATLSPWERKNGPRRAGISSFGIGGTNAHVILEEAPQDDFGDEGEEQ